LVLLGCWVYCVLAIAAAFRHTRQRQPAPLAKTVFISILKPLSGLDEGLEENLRSYFEQSYANFEMLFAVRWESDPAVPVVRRLMAEYPAVPAKLLFTGEPPYAHAKVFSLKLMLDQARYELIAMADSDVRVAADFCTSLAAEFQDQTLGLVTCPYRAVSGNSIWSRLEAVGMNTDFHAGLFTAAMMEGAAKFAVGPTIVARRSAIDVLGGIESVKDYLAEDFMLGRLASDHVGVRLSPYVVEHRIGSETAIGNFAHRLRWARSCRRSRPAGYIGQFFTHTLAVGSLLTLICPDLWPTLVVTVALRAAAAWIVSKHVLGERVQWLLLPLQDLLAFAFWIAGFFGNSIEWRGRRYLLNRDGTMELAIETPEPVESPVAL
jgi:ceramide glucosyltransferase